MASRLKSLLGEPSPSATVALAVLVALLGLVPQYLSRTIPDVAFPLWAAGRVLDGATLYVDILEINPPLFIWLDIPLVAFARWTGLDPILVFRLAVTCLLLGSVIGVARVMGGSAARQLGGSAVEIVAVAFVLFVLPRLDWGEREHLALALMLPWLAVAVRRVEGKEVPSSMALMSGLVAGVGIALKPHFVLVWVGREIAWRLGGSAARRLGDRAGGADTWAPVLVCIAYLLAAFIFAPEYFPLVRELAGPYSQFIRATVVEAMYGPAPAVALTAIVVAMGLRKLTWGGGQGEGEVGPRSLNLVPAIAVLFCVTTAWSVVALLQLKGFRYHWYPAMALGFLLLCHLALVARGVHISFTFRLFRSVAAAAVVATIVLTSWGAVRQAANPLAPEWDADPSIGLLLEALEGRVEPGDTLAVLSPNMASGFPLTNYLGTVWPLRLPHLWPAISEYRAQLDAGLDQEPRAASEMTPLERWALGLVSTDLERHQPQWLLLFRHISNPDAPYMSRARMRDFVGRDSLVNEILNAYDSVSTVGLYTIWARD